MTGVYTIVQDMKPKCPHCRRAIDLTEFSQEIFRRIREALAEHHRVVIPGFGSFRARYTKGHQISVFGGKLRHVSGRFMVHFRASPATKEAINRKITKDESYEEAEI